jgi:hypothetical protein
MEDDREARLAALAIVEAHATNDWTGTSRSSPVSTRSSCRVVGVLVAMVASTRHPGGIVAAVARARAVILAP